MVRAENHSCGGANSGSSVWMQKVSRLAERMVQPMSQPAAAIGRR